MLSRVRVDIMVLQNRPWPVLRGRARRAEEMGFTGLWVTDHLVNPYRPEQDWFEAWTLMGALALATSNIRIGPMVSSLSMRNPVLLARAAMTLDHLSGGRFDLAIGAGGAPFDHAMTAIPPFDAPGERAERLEEAVGIVSDLLRAGRAERSDGYYPVHGAVVHPAPVQGHLPITVGALGRSALRTAARHADVWNTQGMARGKDLKGLLPHDDAVAVTRERSEYFDRMLEEEGRDPAEVRRSYLMSGTYSGGIPSVEEFLAQAEDLRGAGMQELIIYWPGDESQEAALERLAAEALPRLPD
jgi:alkanesulfonate monooxygenase SsuD/methylene tetrahydromethanopterin reductase-like flavin-dependent oxidoreductase (luciferase family)